MKIAQAMSGGGGWPLNVFFFFFIHSPLFTFFFFSWQQLTPKRFLPLQTCSRSLLGLISISIVWFSILILSKERISLPMRSRTF
jgi:hypothetical protein